jgi:hypothetical protein
LNKTKGCLIANFATVPDSMCLREKIGPDPRNFHQRVSLGRNDLLIRTFLNIKTQAETFLARYKNAKLKNHYDVLGIKCSLA